MNSHILILSDIHQGGEWISVVRLAEATKKISQNRVAFSVIGFVSEYKPKLSFAKSFIGIPHASAKKPISFIKKLLRDFLNARHILNKYIEKENNIELFWASDYFMVLVLLTLRSTKKRKIVFHFQGLRSSLIKNRIELDYRQIIVKLLERLALLLSDVTVVPSEFAKAYVQSMIRPFKRKNIHVVLNVIPEPFYTTHSTQQLVSFQKEIGIRRNIKIIIYVGRLVRNKGIENLVDAFVRYHHTYPRSVLIFAYPRSSADHDIWIFVKDRIKKNNLRKNIKMITDLETAKLRKLYQIASLLVLPSEFEMAPLVVSESIASGTPSLTTDVGSVANTIKQIDSKLLLANNSVQEIVDKLRYFHEIPIESRKRMKKRVKKIAERQRDQLANNGFYKLLQSLRV